MSRANPHTGRPQVRAAVTFSDQVSPGVLPRKDRRAIVGLFILASLIALAAFGYVFVLASHVKDESHVTHNGICVLLAQAHSARNLTPEQQNRLVADDKLFDCHIQPSTVRTPVP